VESFACRNRWWKISFVPLHCGHGSVDECMTIKTDRQIHETFLNYLRVREKECLADLDRAKYAVNAIREQMQTEETYLRLEDSCEPSKPSASDAVPTES
jgi:hypothetical protein